MPKANSQFKIRDNSDEYSSVRVFNGDITAVSLPGFLSDLGALRTAILAVIEGNVAFESWVGDVTTVNDTRPPKAAQRELKWLVRYHGDSTMNKYTFTIPTADVDLVLDGTDLMDMTLQAAIDLVGAIEAFARTPDDSTETVTVDEIRLVGRNI